MARRRGSQHGRLAGVATGALSLFLAAATPAWTDERGRALFEPCRSCHALNSDAEAAAGPHLAGLIGRRIGGDPRFDYSPVLRNAGARGLTWTQARLDAFLADPEEMFPGLWMIMRGPADPAERAALISFMTAPGAR